MDLMSFMMVRELGGTATHVKGAPFWWLRGTWLESGQCRTADGMQETCLSALVTLELLCLLGLCAAAEDMMWCGL